MTRLVIFDVDGTLVDSEGHIHAAMGQAFAGAGLAPPPRAEVRAIVGLSLEVAMARLTGHGDITTHARLAALYRAAYHALRSDTGTAASSPLYPGARAALHALRAQPETLLALATGKSRRGLDALIEGHGLQGLFACRQTADSHPSKPHPSMILACLEETGLAPRQAVMVGDTSFDMEMAAAAGVAGIGVSWGYHLPETLGADALIDDFAALPGAVDKLLGSAGMTDWAAKVFWSAVATTETEEGWQVTLDGKPIRTPGRQALALPTRALAERVAADWRAQEGRIRPETMHATRTANSAIEKVAPQRDAVAEMLAGYAETDLLCYRAEAPAELVAREAAAWDPLLAWSAESLGAPLNVTAGVMAVEQPAASLARLHARVEALGDFQLAAFHDLVALSGSLILGLAVQERRLEVEAAWDISRIDETWQQEQWGVDEEAEARIAVKHQAFLDAAAFLAAATPARA